MLLYILPLNLQMELIRPQTGAVEMDQDLLWEQVQQTIKEAIQGEVLIKYS